MRPDTLAPRLPFVQPLTAQVVSLAALKCPQYVTHTRMNACICPLHTHVRARTQQRVNGACWATCFWPPLYGARMHSFTAAYRAVMAAFQLWSASI